MELQPPGRRAAQAIGVVLVVAGALLLVTALASLSGRFLGDPRAAVVPSLALGLVGVVLLILGSKLPRWGSRSRN